MDKVLWLGVKRNSDFMKKKIKSINLKFNSSFLLMNDFNPSNCIERSENSDFFRYIDFRYIFLLSERFSERQPEFLADNVEREEPVSHAS